MTEEQLAALPVLMLQEERVALFNLILRLKPTKCLEIGTYKGGSAAIIVAALDEVGVAESTLTCVSLNDGVRPNRKLWKTLEHKAKIHLGDSHKVLPKWKLTTNYCFDFVFIDGDHSYEGCLSDIINSVELMESGHILLHDTNNKAIADAIVQALNLKSQLSNDEIILSDSNAIWGGLTLLKVSK